MRQRQINQDTIGCRASVEKLSDQLVHVYMDHQLTHVKLNMLVMVVEAVEKTDSCDLDDFISLALSVSTDIIDVDLGNGNCNVYLAWRPLG